MTLLTEVFGYDSASQQLDIEVLGSLIVRCNDGHMVDAKDTPLVPLGVL
jgi:hypothetical protein